MNADKNDNPRFSTRFWALALAAVFIACAAGALLLARHGGGRTLARIAVDGRVIREIDLSAVADEFEFEVETSGGVNTVRVRPGGIRVSHADCPDQVCVNQGWLEGGRIPIVCLPHRLVITLENGGDDGFDVVSG